MKENKERTKINHYESLDSWNAVDTYFTENLVNEDEALSVAKKSGESTTIRRETKNYIKIFSEIGGICYAKTDDKK